MEIENVFEMSFLANTANESFARATIAAFCAQINPTLEELNDIKTAVSEAITNCIVHAYRNKKEGVVYCSVKVKGEDVCVTIQDEGEGIEDVEKAMQAFYTSKPNEERSGMGFTLMQTFMDEVQVESTPGAGTKVIMRKRISQDVVA